MTQEEKYLLLQDLCARLPYGVKVCVEGDYFYDEIEPYDTTLKPEILGHLSADVYLVKPYFRPMSSMTEEEKKEYLKVRVKICTNTDDYGQPTQYELCNDFKTYDWLNAHHFDYRGLIPMGLALEAPEDIYKEE